LGSESVLQRRPHLLAVVGFGELPSRVLVVHPASERREDLELLPLFVLGCQKQEDQVHGMTVRRIPLYPGYGTAEGQDWLGKLPQPGMGHRYAIADPCSHELLPSTNGLVQGLPVEAVVVLGHLVTELADHRQG
jgi:hypothetical protein